MCLGKARASAKISASRLAYLTPRPTLDAGPWEASIRIYPRTKHFLINTARPSESLQRQSHTLMTTTVRRRRSARVTAETQARQHPQGQKQQLLAAADLGVPLVLICGGGGCG
jgi:hypothetical protein